MAQPEMCSCQSERRAADESRDERSGQLAALFTAHRTHFKGSLAKQGLGIARYIFYINPGRDSSHDFSSLITR